MSEDVTNNGIKGSGPFRFSPMFLTTRQEGCSPLRQLSLVTWKDERVARELKSAAEIKAAEKAGRITIERPGVVVNMPLLTWPGGRR